MPISGRASNTSVQTCKDGLSFLSGCLGGFHCLFFFGEERCITGRAVAYTFAECGLARKKVQKVLRTEIVCSLGL